MNEENSVRENISRESILKFVESFHGSGDLKEVTENLHEIIVSLQEWRYRLPRKNLARCISALCTLYFFLQQMGNYLDEVNGKETTNTGNDGK